ncbi:hypothetical protein GGI20_004781 [Coemansia sp. BCRC 34301]|nr:hypothetical protein GGI20_004781 [Coemansia sp. BCRC 34301]
MRFFPATCVAFRSRPFLQYHSPAMSGTSFSKATKLPLTAAAEPWSTPALRFRDTFTRELPGDPVVPTAPYEMMSGGEVPIPQAKFRMSRAVRGALWSWAVPEAQENPRLAGVSSSGAALLGLKSEDFWRDPHISAAVWSGNSRLPGSNPWAHCYGGHQFGVWADQLGDGRAVSLGQVAGSDAVGDVWEVQLKGAGRTPYSRFADGYAVRRSSIREYLAAEHMSALGVPTSRSLTLVFTDREVEREEIELGAVVSRLAPSWVRFGSFELPASRSDYKLLRELADYVVRNYYPELLNHHTAPVDSVYIQLLQRVVERTATMVAAWQAVGFCHGVMNTDNMSVLGLTIDYGPFAFLDAYDPDFICNHSDPTGRYAFCEQPRVALWNLVRLAGPLSRLVGPDPEADASSETLDAVAQTLNLFGPEFSRKHADIMRRKFGLAPEHDGDDDMAKVIQPFLDLLERGHTDYAFAMRALCNVPLLLASSDDDLLEQHIGMLTQRSDCNRIGGSWTDDMRAFYKDVYGPRLAAQGVTDKTSAEALGSGMRLANPRYVLRNWVAQDIIERADKGGDIAYVDQALELLTTYAYADTVPEHLQEMAERYAGPVPKWGEGLQCSCSS